MVVFSSNFKQVFKDADLKSVICFIMQECRDPAQVFGTMVLEYMIQTFESVKF